MAIIRGQQSERVVKWTEARYWQFIRSALRVAWMKFPNRYEALRREGKKVERDDGKPTLKYKCADCGGMFKNLEVQVDHIEDAGSLSDYNDLPGFVSRLFCKTEGLQVLCKPCHITKTKAKREEKKLTGGVEDE